ncbi:MAG: PQQ-dependent sugar dehydrogenase, partial [Flavobacteriaceae bacterium]
MINFYISIFQRINFPNSVFKISLKKSPIFRTGKSNGFGVTSAVVFCILIFNGNILYSQLPTDFQRVDIVTDLSYTTGFKIAPDGRIFLINRIGEVFVYDPVSQTTVKAGGLSTWSGFEDGLIGIALDPNFSSNGYIYLHYSLTPADNARNRVSRFTMNGNVLDKGAEVVLLEWDTQREECCHSGGDMAFDSQGNLYIAIGDNTHHTEYTTFDELEYYNSSEDTSSNTNDLRGKILRITPQPDGSYTIPSGNLFPVGTANTLPEIYAMGARNPYRMAIDSNDWLFWGEVGPDANSDSSEGPKGLDEMNLTKVAGNYGWPYFSGNGILDDFIGEGTSQNSTGYAYQVDYAPTPYYNAPSSPQNISVWNTGLTTLPAAEPAWMDFFHGAYMAGAHYTYNASLSDDQRLPIDFDGAFFFFDFNTSQIWATKMDVTGIPTSTERLAPTVFPSSTDNFIDMEMGADGHLYILEYHEGTPGEGKLVRVDYTGILTNRSPEISLSANPTNGALPLTVDFSTVGTYDPDGDSPLFYSWDFETDGNIDSTEENPIHEFTVAGDYNVQLQVDDGNGGISVQNITINAGNTKTVFTIGDPIDGGFFDYGDDIQIEVTGMDAEDGAVDCSNIQVLPGLGHLDHVHDDIAVDGCLKTLTLDGFEEGHNVYGENDLFASISISHTDQGGLLSIQELFLHPKRKEAEFHDGQTGTVEITNTDPWGGGSKA